MIVPTIGGAFVAPTSTPSARLMLAVGHRGSSIPKIIDGRLKLVEILLGCSLGMPEELPSITEAEGITSVDSVGTEASGLGSSAALAAVVLVVTAPGRTGQLRFIWIFPVNSHRDYQQDKPEDRGQNN